MFSLRFYLYGLHGFGGVLTALVVMMSGFVGMRAYVGEAIVCFPPGEFTIKWRKFVDNMCWVCQGQFQGQRWTLQREIVYTFIVESTC